ncbi:MAG: aryldialkylphosphatase [Bryobacteraceae bacterium]|nr:MAG: aryldialkylphosphatase [Bryobacteraceae bacterium]
MERRQFLWALAAAARPDQHAVPGSVLVHEHILVDFGGVKSPSKYDRGEVVRAARPHLEELKKYGCVRLLECTPQGLGRDPLLMQMLARLTGLEIWTNTGIYGAANRSGVPAWAWQENPKQLAKRWIAEWRKGVEGVRPRFIKTAVNGFPLEELDRRLIEAAAITSLETGMTIASHTNGGGRAADAQLAILDRCRCPLDRFVWVHAQNEKDHAWHERVARAGAWVEFDGIGPKTLDWHIECVRFMQRQGLLGRTLVSQDAGWYHAEIPGGGEYRGYTYIYTDFLPAFPAEIRRQLVVDNPRAAFGK